VADNFQQKRLFGVALDPSDDPWSLELKQAWMTAAGERREEDAASYTDPYDAVTGELKKILKKRNIRPVGKFPLPSWLWPKPHPQDFPLVTTAGIGEFYDSGGLPVLIKQLQGFVENEIFPAVPVMVGVDHSATMGVISALSEKYGPDNISVIVLDQHFDAIPLTVRVAEVEGAEANSMAGVPLGTPRVPTGYQDQCCCGNFWAYLMEEGKVRPQNLSFIGVADYPGKPSDGVDTPFQKSYQSFEKRGCRFFPLPQFDKPYAGPLSRFIREGIKTPLVYVSLDLDVGSYNFTWAARYMDRPGISAENLIDIASRIRDTCQENSAGLAGLDIMEFNMHFLGIETDDGVKDATLQAIEDFIDTLTK
jgi:arginase family enzyme